eukprot:NODE_2991_length_1050_cov_1211.327194_g2584_i10.p1 GENE.NODE_2991_length_1050_cov_1211.327194_g2584_i10~~NODE_2991_length_1050_cov_1211.327194_g2584_i10.p1  ORF type:complete len:288 (-),score=48.17 NODE_2991_length_1050_cov_1211.327194_g2584_i10:101-964(-)
MDHLAPQACGRTQNGLDKLLKESEYGRNSDAFNAFFRPGSNPHSNPEKLPRCKECSNPIGAHQAAAAGNEDMLAGAIRVMFATKELADRGVTTISRNRAFHGRVAEYYHFHFCFVSGQRPSQGQNRVEAAHILPLTLIGALEFENTDQLTDINDPRNGLLLTHDIHADFDHHYVYFEVDSSRPRDVRIYFRVITATVGGPSPTSRRFDGQRIAFEQHRLPALHLLQRHAKLAQQRQFQFQASGLLRLQLPPDDEPEGPRALCADEMAAYESRRLGAISKCWGKLLRA